jgi:hypothetical protein
LVILHLASTQREVHSLNYIAEVLCRCNSRAYFFMIDPGLFVAEFRVGLRHF